MLALLSLAKSEEYKYDAEEETIYIKANEMDSLFSFRYYARNCTWHRVVLTGSIKEVPSLVFCYIQLTSISLPDTIEKIRYEAFMNTSLVAVEDSSFFSLLNSHFFLCFYFDFFLSVFFLYIDELNALIHSYLFFYCFFLK